MDITTILIQLVFVGILSGMFFGYRHLKKKYKHDATQKLLDILYNNIVEITKAVKKDLLTEYSDSKELDLVVIKKNVIKNVREELPEVYNELKELLDGDLEGLIEDWVKAILDRDDKKNS